MIFQGFRFILASIQASPPFQQQTWEAPVRTPSPKVIAGEVRAPPRACSPPRGRSRRQVPHHLSGMLLPHPAAPGRSGSFNNPGREEARSPIG
jgi:hypothetical protein